MDFVGYYKMLAREAFGEMRQWWVEQMFTLVIAMYTLYESWPLDVNGLYLLMRNTIAILVIMFFYHCLRAPWQAHARQQASLSDLMSRIRTLESDRVSLKLTISDLEFNPVRSDIYASVKVRIANGSKLAYIRVADRSFVSDTSGVVRMPERNVFSPVSLVRMQLSPDGFHEGRHQFRVPDGIEPSSLNTDSAELLVVDHLDNPYSATLRERKQAMA